MKKQKPTGAKIEITKDGPYLVSGGLPLDEQACRSFPPMARLMRFGTG